ncbi:MAG: hypothetical protein HKN29_11170 [Rhodothermales bacterium]|nr:hypothetical protein [Rhodothermales bacterium]
MSVSYIVEFNIKDGKVDEFKALAHGFIKEVEANEPGTLGYEWYLGDGGRCLIQETFEDSAALLTHLGNVGPSLPKLLEIAPIAGINVLGEVSDDARAALAGLGATFHSVLGGFRR